MKSVPAMPSISLASLTSLKRAERILEVLFSIKSSEISLMGPNIIVKTFQKPQRLLSLYPPFVPYLNNKEGVLKIVNEQ